MQNWLTSPFMTVNGEKRYAHSYMEPPVLHLSETDAVRDMVRILQRVRAGMEVVIERDTQPIAVVRAATPVHRTISECIAFAKAHEEETRAPTLDPDFAADVEGIIRNRKLWNPPSWD
jgi:antitoxin (DNA-binding transcriptional repressor) of toxin-antitoxin stability system